VFTPTFQGRARRQRGQASPARLCRCDARRPVADARVPVPAVQRPRRDLLCRRAARDPGVEPVRCLAGLPGLRRQSSGSSSSPSWSSAGWRPNGTRPRCIPAWHAVDVGASCADMRKASVSAPSTAMRATLRRGYLLPVVSRWVAFWVANSPSPCARAAHMASHRPSPLQPIAPLRWNSCRTPCRGPRRRRDGGKLLS
jgi:hypothetical protein